MSFDLNRIRGILSPTSADDRIATLEKSMEEGLALEKLQQSPEWPYLDAILNRLYNKAVQKLGAEDFEERDWWRVNHEAALFHAIRDEIKGAVARAATASAEIKKIQSQESEKNDRANR